MPEDEQKPYTRYKSSRFKLRNKPLKTGGKDGSGPQADFPGQPGGPYGPGQGPAAPGQPVAGQPLPQVGKQRRWGRYVLLAFLLLLLAALLALGVSYWRLDRAVDASNARVPVDAKAALHEPAGGMLGTPQNILFIGSDTRPGEKNARADTILIMRVDGSKKVISQLSIPRDTLAVIPDHGEDKINAAYYYGGAALEIQTVENLTGILINHYVELNFDGFPGIVDGFGGVDINVPKTIDSQYPNGLEWTTVHFDAGEQHMSGARALTFVRVRYSDDDFQRMGRQQLFMEALQKKATSPVNLMKMPWLAPGIVDNITTDLSTNELIELGWNKFRTPRENNHKCVVVGAPEDIGGGSYVVLDESTIQSKVQDFLAGRCDGI